MSRAIFSLHGRARLGSCRGPLTSDLRPPTSDRWLNRARLAPWLLAAAVAGAQAYIGNNAVALGQAYAPLPADGRVQIGVRPDFVTLAPSGGPPVQVQRIADFGRKRLAHVTLGGLPLVATVPDGMTSIGSEACVRFDPARVLVYHNDVRVAGLPT